MGDTVELNNLVHSDYDEEEDDDEDHDNDILGRCGGGDGDMMLYMRLSTNRGSSGSLSNGNAAVRHYSPGNSSCFSFWRISSWLQCPYLGLVLATLSSLFFSLCSVIVKGLVSLQL